MGISYAERRQIENEMIFRRANEKVSDGLATLDAMHIEDGNVSLIQSPEMELHFKCECSDENCQVGIPMSISTYQEIHTDRDTFVVLTGHQVDAIETILKRTPDYVVVKKDHSTSEPTGELNSTPIDNS